MSESRKDKLLKAIEIAERHGNVVMAQNIRRVLYELEHGKPAQERPGKYDVF